MEMDGQMDLNSVIHAVYGNSVALNRFGSQISLTQGKKRPFP
jgi:hypothetical protein